MIKRVVFSHPIPIASRGTLELAQTFDSDDWSIAHHDGAWTFAAHAGGEVFSHSGTPASFTLASIQSECPPAPNDLFADGESSHPPVASGESKRKRR